MFQDLLDDLRDPGLLWQLGLVALCMLLGWGLARALRNAWLRSPGAGGEAASRAGARAMFEFGVESLARVLSPLLIVLFLTIARYALAKHMHVNVLRVAIPLFGSLALIRATFFLLRRVFGRQGTVGAALMTFEKIWAMLVWLAVALYLLGAWPDIFAWLHETRLPLGHDGVSLSTILQGLLSVAVTLMLALWAGAALEDRLMHVETMHTSLRVVLARMGRAVLVLVAVLLSLSMVGIDLTVLSVFGGALGVGLGLGLQKIASNYVSGFVILFERGLSIGDMIGVDKYYGKITQINTRYTVLQGLDGIDTVVPNEMLISGAVLNYSLTSRLVRVTTQVMVGYNTDLPALYPLLEACAAGAPRVLAQPAPAVALTRFSPDGIELELGFSIEDPENGRGGVISDVNKRIWSMLKEQNIPLPFAQKDAQIAAVLAGLANNQQK